MKKLFLILLLCPVLSFGQYKPEGTTTITSGTATTISNGIGRVIVNPASVLLTHTITLPSAPRDKDVITVQFGGTIIGGAGVVTTLTVAAGGGVALLGALPTVAVAGQSNAWTYSISTNSWYRLY